MITSAKRILALVLCALLIGALFSSPAFAAEEKGSAEETEEQLLEPDTTEESDELSLDPEPVEGEDEPEESDSETTAEQEEDTDGEETEEQSSEEETTELEEEEAEGQQTGDKGPETGDFTVTGDGEYAYADHVLQIHSGSVTVSGETTEDRIVVDGSAAVTLDGVSITATDGAALTLTPDSGSVTILLSGENELNGGDSYAGLEVGYGDESSAALTLKGSGTLTAVGGDGSAGIGGSYARALGRCGEITITGGKITAIGGADAAGIGTGADLPKDEQDEDYEAQVRAEVNIDGGSVVAYADGTKFAIDSKSGGGTETASAPLGEIHDVLQGTFVDDGNHEGLSIRILSHKAAENESLSLKLPKGYRSFAVSVDGAEDGYVVYSPGMDVYFAAVDDEFFTGTASGDPTVFDAADSFCDVFYLYEDNAAQDVEILKIWDDGSEAEDYRPDSIHWTLLDGEDTVMSADLTGEDNWRCVYRGLPGGAAYSVTEDAVANYKTEIVDRGVTDGIRLFQITNTLAKENTKLTVNVVWDDDNNSAKRRPDSVQITLLIDGQASTQRLMLSGPEWSGTFSDLPVEKDGKKIEYSARQKTISYYNLISSEQLGTTVTFTNRYVKPIPPAPTPTTLYYVTDDLVVKKQLVGKTPPEMETFYFTLEAVSTSVSSLKGNMPMPSGSRDQKKTVSLYGPGETSFGLMTFSQTGTYTYRVKEVIGNTKYFYYDESVYTVKYEVTQNGNALRAVRSITRNGKGESALTFINGYSTRPRTGDERNAALWGVLSGLALCGVAIPATILIRRRRNRNK